MLLLHRAQDLRRARPMAAIVEEIEQLAAKGTREVTLLGQIVNQHGIREFPFVDQKSPFNCWKRSTRSTVSSICLPARTRSASRTT